MTQSTEVLVREVMSTRVVTIQTTNTLSDALDRFRLTGLRHLVVTDETGRCAGVVSDRTISAVWPGAAMSGLQHRIGDVLHPGRPTARPDETVSVAARRMLGAGVDALPVVDGSEDVVGIVTGSDLVRVLATSDRDDIVAGDRR